MANKIGNWIESQRIESNRLWAWKVWPKIKLYLWNCNSIKFSKHTNCIGPSTNVDAAAGYLPFLPSLPSHAHSLFTQAEQQQAKLVCIISLALIYSKCNRNCSPKSSVSDYMREIEIEREGDGEKETSMEPYANISIVYIECLLICAM